ncbi:MAG: HD domain-containing protein [Bacilli bacterium]|nr:HD domain-containing protein [Bacilli bacterium]
MKTIAELVDGDHVYGQFLVTNVTKGVTTGSKNYLTITFQDSTGTMDGKRWDYAPEDPEIFVPGNIVNLEAEVISYKEHLQMKVLGGSKVDIDHIDFARFVPSAPVDRELLIAKLDGYLSSFKNEEVSKLTNYIVKKFREKYLDWPAAVRNHHNYVSGLLYHSLSMADLAEKVCLLYPSINRDVLVAGALIHDLGKTIELSGPVATQFTLEGKLLGHISIMQAEVRKAAAELGMEGEMPVIFEHMVLSHHGIPEYGSAVMPLTREAVVLNMIDDMDAKMAILDKAYADVKPGEYTNKVFTMDERYFYKPLYTAKK